MADDLPPPTPEQQAAQQFKQDVSELLTLPTFRRFLWHLLDSSEWSRAHGLSSVGPSGHLLIEHERVFFAEGRRSIGVELSAFVRSLHPRAYMQMIQEALGMRLRQPSPPVQVTPPRPPKEPPKDDT